MLKHLPEGLVPFEDCGFARHPVAPEAGQPVTVCCRVDEQDGEPELLYSVNDAPERADCTAEAEGRFRRFALGSYAFGDQIRYRLRTQAEQSPIFAFEVQHTRRVTSPQQIIRGENCIAVLLDGLTLLLTARERADEQMAEQPNQPLCIRTLSGEQSIAGESCEEAELALPNGFSVSVSKCSFIWQLKRLSNPLLTVTAYELREGADGQITQTTLCATLCARYLWGTGERFDAVNQRDRASNGRVTEKFTHQGDQTYMPIPFFMTEQGMGLYRKGDIPARMAFGEALTIAQEVDQADAPLLTEDLLFFGSPAEQLSQFIEQTGKPVLPPDWAFGLWISANGWSNDAEVAAQLAALKGLDYPADVMVLEAWSDEMTFCRWNDDGSWADPAQTVRDIRDAGLHLVLWQIPIIKHEWNKAPSEALKRQLEEAVEKGYCVVCEDGKPYRITENWFHNSLLPDFTNPEAVRWWFAQREHLLDMGVEGFKTDGGEFLFDPRARLADGTRGLAAHNRYPAQYIGAYHNFMRAHGVNGVTFSRADFVGAQTRPMHWAGDQTSEWSELSAQLTAGLSAGLSGVLFWGFDIGGFAGELPTKELYLRATAMGCFCPVMQWHAEPRNGQFYSSHKEGFNNDRSPWNLAEKLNDPQLLEIATAFATLRRALRPYLLKEAEYAVRHNRPMMAHLCIDFCDDAHAIASEDSYMLGRGMLVAPVVEMGAVERVVYLPKGVWRHFFTKELYAGEREYRVSCPLETIPVFERMRGDE